MEKIIFLGCTQNFPIEYTASNTKTTYVAKGLLSQDCDVCIINSVNGHNIASDKIDMYDGIKYYTFKSKNNRVLTVICNAFKLYKVLKLERQKNCSNNIIYCYNVYPIFLLERFIVFISGYHFFGIIQEWHSHNKGYKISYIFNRLFDQTFGYFTRGILPISHKLLDLCKHFKKGQMILPILANFDNVPKENKNIRINNSFTYCCSIEYLLRNDLVLSSFKILIDKHFNARLNLILIGDAHKISILKNEIENNQLSDYVIIKSQIPNQELQDLYKKSLALLMPLNPNSFQDITRFSQKIAEYVATSRPIITNNVGEIPYYFTSDSALIVDYTPEAFAEGMISLIENPQKADFIGSNGRKVGETYFDYKKNGKKLIEFIHNL